MATLSPSIIRALRHRATRVAITSSSMRGRSNAGVVRAAQEFLAHLNLRQFSTSDARRFQRALDGATAKLVRRLPKPARHWGLARKGLNIFLRECLYTVYLRERFALAKAEEEFEIPLDSYTGKALRANDVTLPRWKTVKGVDKNLNRLFQESARRHGRRRGVARVHLDAVWWGERRHPPG